MTKLSTSPNECHYTTLWNTTCVNLFITTVIQALNVMTNGQLRTNTSQQCSKCLPGFDWPVQNASFPGDLKGSFVCPRCTLVTECQIIDCINVLSSTWCARCATAQLSICRAGLSQFLKKIIQTAQTPSFLWKLVN